MRFLFLCLTFSGLLSAAEETPEEDRWIRVLESNDRAKKREAVGKLAHLGSSRAIPKLLKMLQTESLPTIGAIQWDDPDGTMDLRDALRTIFDKNERGTLSAFAAALSDPDPVIRGNAAGQLAAIGPDALPALPALADDLEDPDPYVRACVAEALFEIGADAPVYFPVVRTLLTSPNARVRSVALRTFMKMRVQLYVAIPAIVECLRMDSKESHRPKAAQRALAAMGAKATKSLQSLLEDPDKRVRTACVEALGSAAAGQSGAWVQSTVATLVRATEDPEEEVRLSAIEGLGLIGTEARTAVPALVDVLKEESERIKRKAVQSLGRIGISAVVAAPALVAALVEGRIEQGDFLEAIGKMGPGATPYLPVLLRALEDEEPHIRLSAAKAIARLGPTARRAVPALEKAFNDPAAKVRVWASCMAVKIQPQRSSELRETTWRSLRGCRETSNLLSALEALGELGPQGKDFIPFLLEVALRADDGKWSPPPFVVAGSALANVALEETEMEPLLKALRDADSQRRWQAIYTVAALKKIPGSVLPELLRVLEDGSYAIRASCITALGKVGGRDFEVSQALNKAARDRSLVVRQRVREVMRARKQRG